jgi:hypothetical protein
MDLFTETIRGFAAGMEQDAPATSFRRTAHPQGRGKEAKLCHMGHLLMEMAMPSEVSSKAPEVSWTQAAKHWSSGR